MAASLFEVVRSWARTAGDAIAAVDGPGRDGATIPEVTPSGPPVCLTYAALHEAAERLAGALAPLLATASSASAASSPAAEACKPRPLAPPSLASDNPGAVIATWMRRGNGWYCVFCAAARLQAPLVALSSDLPDKAAERQRNGEVLEAHRPLAVILDDCADLNGLLHNGHPAAAAWASARLLLFPELWAQAWAVDQRPAVEAVAVADATLCYCYTGGTTKASRCAAITHRMALHETAAYSRVASLGHEDSVLQQHSVYWAASAYGEVDIALAFGCRLVFCEAWDAEGVANAIRSNSVTCAGLVPSVLAALVPVDVPSLRLVFTWGEALQPRIAREWAQRVHLLDLLISTECWLSLYADWSAEVKANGFNSQRESTRPPFMVLPGAEVRLRPVLVEDSPGTASPGCRATPAGAGDVGELLVAGPMVSPGYTDTTLTSESFDTDAAGTRWYCTHDCVEWHPGGGLVFAGRTDDLVKVAGAWVDVREVEARLAGVKGVLETCICGRRAFMALADVTPGLLSALRALLPADFTLFLVPAPLPRNSGTGKVDRRRLSDLVAASTTGKAMTATEERESMLCVKDLTMLLGWYRPLYALGAAALFRAGLNLPMSRLGSRAGGGLASSFVTTAVRDLPCLALPLGLRVAGELAWRLPCLSYMILCSWHSYGLTAACGTLPIGVHSLAVAATAMVPGPAWGLACAAPGMILAARGGRLLSWPLVCAVGFPVWARDAGSWLPSSLAQHGIRGVANWYFWKAAGPIVSLSRSGAKRGAAAVKKAWRRMERWVGRTRRCGWCRELRPVSAGWSDPLVDSRWYCEVCWGVYGKYELCTRCKKWTHRFYLTTIAGVGVCKECIPLLPTPTSGGTLNGEQQPPDSGGTLNGGTLNGGTLNGGTLNGGALNGDCNRKRKRPMIEPISANTARCFLKLSSPSGPQPVDPAAADPEPKEGQQDGPVGTAGTATASAAASVPKKSREWRLIERATGLTFDSLSDPLSSLDSLRRTKMTSLLRRELGKRLTRQVLQRNSTLGELLSELARLPEEQQAPSTRVRGGTWSSRRGSPTWGLMWYSRCQWTLRRSRDLPEDVLNTALGHLVERHEALHAELRDPYRLFGAVQQAFTVFELWRLHGSSLGASLGAEQAVRRFLGRRAARALRLAGRFAAKALSRTVRWSFRNAWPRVGTAADTRPSLRVLSRCATSEKAEMALSRATRRFTPPFEAVLVPFGGSAGAGDTSEVAEGAFLHLAVTHMLSDGYSIVPLLSDLAQLVARTEEPASGTDGGAKGGMPPLPPVPSMLEAMEPRLMRTIDGDADNSTVNPSINAGGGITREPITKIWSPKAFTVFVLLPAEEVAAIRRAARTLAVPEDVIVLAGLGTAVARFQGKRTMPIAMIVPQRDGPAENDMVGLFADVRHLTICTGGLSFAGVALQLHHVVERRLWREPGLATQFDVPLVNFEWTDFEEIHGFSQHVNLGEWPESARYPLKVAVEQPDRETWRMRVSFDTQVYPQPNSFDFLGLLDTCFHALLERPLDLVWPDSADACGGKSHQAPAPEVAPAVD